MNHSRINFASDNASGIHPIVFQAIERVNQSKLLHPSYGADPETEQFLKNIRQCFGSKASAFLVFNGTAANVLSIQSMLKPYQSLIAASVAHLHVDESGAPEKIAGVKTLSISSPDGKLSPELILPYLKRQNDLHHSQVKMISITQTTENGLIYTPAEIQALKQLCLEHQLILHMDGARLANAAAALSLNLGQMTTELGVDVLSLGGTKNGLMGVEAVVFRDASLSEDFIRHQKQNCQLASKMRFLSAQMNAYLEKDLWLKLAEQANLCAERLATGLKTISQISFAYPHQANAVFVHLPKKAIDKLQKQFYFYVWNEDQNLCRLMTSFETSIDQVDRFIEEARRACLD